MLQVQLVDGADVDQVDVVVLAPARNRVGGLAEAVGDEDLLVRRNEVADVGAHRLAPHAGAQGQVVGGLPTALEEEGAAVGIDVRVAAQLGLFTGYQPAAGGGERQVEEHLVGREFFPVQVHPVGQAGALPGLHQGQFHPVVVGVLLRGRVVGGAVVDRAGIAVADGREGIEGHLLVAVVGLQVEVVAQHFRRVVGGVELMALALRLAVEVDAALDRIGCPSAQGIEVAPKIEAAVAVVAGVVVLQAEIEAVAIGESEAKAAHQVHRPVVLQVGLGDVRQYLVATAVVGRAVLLVGDGQAAVEQVVAAADRLRRAQVVVLMALEAAAGAQLGVEASVAADALLGHDVDDPAGGAAAVHRAGAGHHLDALDVEWVDGVELPADAP